MNKLLPISIVILLIILVAAFVMRKKFKCTCYLDNGGIKCSNCNIFGFDHFFKKKEAFKNMTSEIPGFYKIRTTFPKLTNKKNSVDY